MNENLKRKIEEKLGKNQLFYVCRDIERAEGLFLPTETPTEINIITNKSPYSLELKEKYPDNIILIDANRLLDTWEILKQIHDNNLIKKNDLILVFKSTKKIEQICKENNWNLINPPAELANLAEEKISQIEWLGDLKKYLPGYKVKEVKDIEFTGEKFIIQFNHSHTGSGTILIESNQQLEKLKEKFPNREARIAKYIKGPLLTNNNIIWGDKILIGNISYQITGLSPFTNNKFATIGNDWKLTSKILNKKQLEDYRKIVKEVGQNFIKDNWKGLFGIDIVIDEKTDQLYLLEINARQPASTSCESWLQTQEILVNPPTDGQNDKSITTFEAHLASLLEIPYENEKLIKIKNGSQIILRKSNKELKINTEELKKDFKLIRYNNDKEGSDWLRMESKTGIMKKHSQFNSLGEKIIKTISNL